MSDVARVLSTDRRPIRASIAVHIWETGDGMSFEVSGRLSKAEMLYWVERTKLAIMLEEVAQELPSDVGQRDD